mgnify:CR=1 FL=1|jgi:hypothetical protein
MDSSVKIGLNRLEAVRITVNITANFSSQAKVSLFEDGKIAVVFMRGTDIVTPDETLRFWERSFHQLCLES